MPLLQIIQNIISALALIVGLFFPKSPTNVRQVASVTNVDCVPVEWTVPPTVSGGTFIGTASVVCRFDAKAGGGIAALRSHLIRTIPGTTKMGQTMVSTYQGLPAFSWRTQLETANGTVVHGTTVIGSNGSSFLRNVFESDSVEGANAQYLKSLYAAVEVTQIEGSQYEIRVSQSIGVKKPFLMTANQFLSNLKSQSEEALLERAVSSAQEMATHL
jgi:hypothetical protein